MVWLVGLENGPHRDLSTYSCILVVGKWLSMLCLTIKCSSFNNSFVKKQTFVGSENLSIITPYAWQIFRNYLDPPDQNIFSFKIPVYF